MGKLRFRVERQAARVLEKGGAGLCPWPRPPSAPGRVSFSKGANLESPSHWNAPRRPARGGGGGGKSRPHSTEGTTEVRDGFCHGAGSGELVLGPSVLVAGEGSRWGAGARAGDTSQGSPPLPPLPAPAPEPRGAAAPYKEASGSPAPGPCYIRAGLLYKARLVGRGVAGLGPGEGSTPFPRPSPPPGEGTVRSPRGWEPVWAGGRGF